MFGADIKQFSAVPYNLQKKYFAEQLSMDALKQRLSIFATLHQPGARAIIEKVKTCQSCIQFFSG